MSIHIAPGTLTDVNSNYVWLNHVDEQRLQNAVEVFSIVSSCLQIKQYLLPSVPKVADLLYLLFLFNTIHQKIVIPKSQYLHI